jgi:CheY-like chemotaxis protein
MIATFHMTSDDLPMQDSMADNNIAEWTLFAVDDDDLYLEFLHHLFDHRCAAVITTPNSIEGLALLERVRPTVILLDISMPDITGVDLLTLVRKMPGACGVPVVAVTARAFLGERDTIMTAGFDGFVAKPFQVEDFLAEIHKTVLKAREA